MRRVPLTVLAAAAVAACTSPESVRTLGGGAGADTGNRGAVVMMHEGSHVYANTPSLNPGAAPALDSARHAHDLSLR